MFEWFKTGCIAIGALVSFGVAFSFTPPRAATLKSPTASVVKINAPKWHGSGVHLGGGMILTAAHVVKGVDEVIIKDAAGFEVHGKPIIVVPEYDFALITSDYGGPSAHMSCERVHVGDKLRAAGNPFDLDFISSTGEVSGAEQVLDHWASVFVATIITGPGMSGGPVFNTKGEIVGITVGGYNDSLGYSFTVPTSTICRLIGRAS